MFIMLAWKSDVKPKPPLWHLCISLLTSAECRVFCGSPVETNFLHTCRCQELCYKLLQQMLHIAFCRCMTASHRGSQIDLPSAESARVSPLALLYVYVKPEELSVMCLNASAYFSPVHSVRLDEGSRARRKRPMPGVGTSRTRHVRHSTTQQWTRSRVRRGDRSRWSLMTALTALLPRWPPGLASAMAPGFLIVCRALLAFRCVYLIFEGTLMCRYQLAAACYCIGIFSTPGRVF